MAGSIDSSFYFMQVVALLVKEWSDNATNTTRATSMKTSCSNIFFFLIAHAKMHGGVK